MYAQLVQLLDDFLEFQRPSQKNGVDDYSTPAMAAQYDQLPSFLNRLQAINTSTWSLEHLNDWRLVKAHLLGFKFEHEVMRPWERDPSFYNVIQFDQSDVPRMEGPCMHASLALYSYQFPLDQKSQDVLQASLLKIPAILSAARNVIKPENKDLLFLAIRYNQKQLNKIDRFTRNLDSDHLSFQQPLAIVKQALADFIVWLQIQHDKAKAGSCGIGIENFNRAMKQVHIVPHDWDSQVAIVKRELERGWTALKLEEHRNRNLAPLLPPASPAEFQARIDQAYASFMDFLRSQNIFSVPDYMHLQAPKNIKELPPQADWNFFQQIEYHQLLPLRCHMVHWLEKQREEHNQHPIRSKAWLYNIWDSRAEGFATGFEETMLQAGLLDNTPRAKELVYILLVFRAARAMGALMYQGQKWTLQEAIDYTAKFTPRNWLKADGGLIISDMSLYLRQPSYGPSYVVGKIQYEQLMAEYAQKHAEDFSLKAFLDDYFARGFIPAELLRLEMV